jgi:hypothetical protein
MLSATILEVPMKPVLRSSPLLAAALALVITGCQVSVSPPPPPTADFVVNAQGETVDPSPRRRFSVPAGGAVVLEVRFPSSGADLMYVEIEPLASGSGLQLESWGPTGATRELVSRSPSLFATTTAALTSALRGGEPAVDRSSISIGWTCFGPCVARSYRAGTTYVRVLNTSGSSRSVDFYAYGLVATDETEPNDTPTTANDVLVTAVGSAVTGAIERVDDRDFHRIHCGSAFPFDNLRLELSSGFAGDIALIVAGSTYGPGQVSAVVPCGSLAEVRTLDGTAGPSAASTYSIIIQ